MNGDDAVELTVATLGRRAAAALLDLFVPLTCWALATWIIVASDPRPLAMPPWNLFDTVIDYLHDRPGRAAASVFVLVVAQVGWPLLFRGASPGKRVAGLALFDGRGVAASRARRLAWALARIPSLALAGIGAWWAIVDPERRTLHDRAARVWLVDTARSAAATHGSFLTGAEAPLRSGGASPDSHRFRHLPDPDRDGLGP